MGLLLATDVEKNVVVKELPKIAIRSREVFDNVWKGFSNLLNNKNIGADLGKFLIGCVLSLSRSTDVELVKNSIYSEISNVLKKIIKGAILSTDPNSISICKAVFRPFVAKRSLKTTSELYENFIVDSAKPFINRYSGCANSLVRARVVQLLSFLFPVIKPSSRTTFESELSQNILIISNSLVDEAPVVRLAGVNCAVNVMLTFRDSIEVELKTDWIKRISELSRDSSAVKVRQTAITAVGALLRDDFYGSLCLSTFDDVSKAIFDPSLKVQKAALNVYEAHLGYYLKNRDSLKNLNNSEITLTIRWMLQDHLSNGTPASSFELCKCLSTVLCSTLSKAKFFRKIIQFFNADALSASVFVYFLPELVTNYRPELISVLLPKPNVLSKIDDSNINDDATRAVLLSFLSLLNNSKLFCQSYDDYFSKYGFEIISILIEILNFKPPDVMFSSIPSPLNPKYFSSLKKSSSYDIITHIIIQIFSNFSSDSTWIDFISDSLALMTSSLQKLYISCCSSPELINVALSYALENDQEELTVLISSLLSLDEFSQVISSPVFSKILNFMKSRACDSVSSMLPGLSSQTAIDPKLSSRVVSYLQLIVAVIGKSESFRSTAITDIITFCDDYLIDLVSDWSTAFSSVIESNNDSISPDFFTSITQPIPVVLSVFVSVTSAILETGCVPLVNEQNKPFIQLCNQIISITQMVCEHMPSSAVHYQANLVDVMMTIISVIERELIVDGNKKGFAGELLSKLQQTTKLLLTICEPKCLRNGLDDEFKSKFKQFIKISFSFSKRLPMVR
ncbi:hypothetical protein GEMRC1_009048 [Eukaryota sp. GEM-RC1]